MSVSGRSIKRIASLLAAIAVLAISFPHVDACRNSDAEMALCCPPEGCHPGAAGGGPDASDGGHEAADDGAHASCCALHHIMIASGAYVAPKDIPTDHAPGGSVHLDSAFVPAPERPPAFA
ncbi:MAG: hypothetical protein IT350_20600 [Deltaproteobacteria bacterium]|nr:hypothetical protein [Deltaproteobacteria bacterium]